MTPLGSLSVRSEQRHNDYIYYISGPAFVRFDQTNGVGFNDRGVTIERVVGTGLLIPDGKIAREYAARNGFFTSESPEVTDRSRKIRALLDNLSWRSAARGDTLTAWAAIRVACDSSAILQITFATKPSVDEEVLTPISEDSMTFRVGPLTTLLLTPHERVQATIIDFQGEVSTVKDRDAVRSFFDQTHTTTVKDYEPQP